jgi:hypothetical protein
MQITQEENNELLAELIHVLSKPVLNKQHEVTVSMLIESTGRSDRTCRAILENKILQEGWKKRAVIDEKGRAINAYYDPAKWSPEEA